MIISKTPLRASFFGGGTDFRDYFENSRWGYGATLSTALDMHVYITVNKKFDDTVRVVYFGNELVDHVSQVKHNIIREAMKIVGIETGIEIVYTADIPLSAVGIGLASSSALAVGVLNALYAYKGIYASPDLLARKACEIEIDRIGAQIGIQDQYAVAFGGFRKYTFNANDTVDAAAAICDKKTLEYLNKSLMLFYTGITRDSQEILREQTRSIAEKMDMLDTLVEMTETAYKNMTLDAIDSWGAALDQSWQIKQRFAGGISNPLISEMYANAKSAGALGGKILGAGGGGFLMLYAPPEAQIAVRKALKDFQEVEFAMDAQGSRIVFSD